MTIISSRVFLENAKYYFELACKQEVAIKRGNRILRLVPDVRDEIENISPSGDPYWADPRNIAELERRLKLRKEGKEESFILTPERQKELLGL